VLRSKKRKNGPRLTTSMWVAQVARFPQEEYDAERERLLGKRIPSGAGGGDDETKQDGSILGLRSAEASLAATRVRSMWRQGGGYRSMLNN
jgi:hypothetical protein